MRETFHSHRSCTISCGFAKEGNPQLGFTICGIDLLHFLELSVYFSMFTFKVMMDSTNYFNFLELNILGNYISNFFCIVHRDLAA